MSRARLLLGAAAALVAAAANGWQGARFSLGGILSRYATPSKAMYDDKPTSYARKTGLTVAAAKRAAIKTKNRAKHRRAVRGKA